MFILIFSLISSVFSAEDLNICFYSAGDQCKVNAFNFSVENFQTFVDASFPVAKTIVFEFLSSLKEGDVINLTKFENDELIKLTFKGKVLSTSSALFALSAESHISAEMIFEHVSPNIKNFNIFSSVSFANCSLTIKDSIVNGTNIRIDGSSMRGLKLIHGEKVSFNFIFSPETHYVIPVASKGENPTLLIESFSTVTLNAHIKNSVLGFAIPANSTYAAFDLENWRGVVTMDHSSLTDRDFFMNLKCLSFSPLTHFPFLHVKFIGQLVLEKSNWPFSTTPLIHLEAVSSSLLYNKIVVAGFIPAKVSTGSQDLQLTPTIASSGFLKVDIQNSNLTIFQPFLLTEEYNFYINEIESTNKENTTLIADPPLLYVYIDRFIGKNNYYLKGSGFYIIHSLPERESTVYVEHLWFNANSHINVPFDAASGAASHIMVTDYVLMREYPTYFTPDLVDGIKDQYEAKKINLICAKLLKKQKESLVLPPNGHRGFVQGASIVQPFYEKQFFQDKEVKCYGFNYTGSVNTVSNILCLAEKSNDCPPGSQFVAEGEKWDQFYNSDVSELTFYLVGRTGISFTFPGFKNLHLHIIGTANLEKVSLSSEGISHLYAQNVELTLTAQDPHTQVDFTNVVFTQDNYMMGELKTDASSLKSIKRKIFEKHIELVGINKESKICIGSQIKLEDNDLEFTAENSTINIDSEKVLFLFSENPRNNSLKAVFSKPSATVDFEQIEQATKYFIISNFSGTLNINSENVPFVLEKTLNLTIQSSNTVNFINLLSIDGSLSASTDISANVIEIAGKPEIQTKNSISTRNLSVMANTVASIPYISVSDILSIFPGTLLTIEKVSKLPALVKIYYNLTSLPQLRINSESLIKPNFELIYDGADFTDAIRNEFKAFREGIPIVWGNNFDCSSISTEFVSDFIIYDGNCSLLSAACHNGALSLILNENPAPTPPPTPAPFIPTQTPVPDNTSTQVVIISCTVIAFFVIIIIIITKCMNRKKKYVSKRDLNTVPLLNAHEGNAE